MPRGGYRPGAGRKKSQSKATQQAVETAARALAENPSSSAGFADAEEFLMSIVNDRTESTDLRLRAAATVIPYQKPKLAEVAKGKKEIQAEVAAEKAVDRFAVPAAPKSAVIGDEKKWTN